MMYYKYVRVIKTFNLCLWIDTSHNYAVGCMSKRNFCNNFLKNIYLQGGYKFVHFVLVKTFS